MGTFKDFLEKLQADEEFTAKINDAVKAKLDAGETDTYKALIDVAEESGYSINEEEIEACGAQIQTSAPELDEEEMGKVAGGTGVVPAVAITFSLFIAVTVEVKDRFFNDKK